MASAGHQQPWAWAWAWACSPALAQPGPRSFVIGALVGAWGAQAYPTGVPDIRVEALRLWSRISEWENPEENIIRANKSLSEIDISSGDLIILPEMFSTGFSMRSELCIEMEQEKNKILHFLQRLAILNSCCVIAGVTTKKNENFFNESLALLPNKKIIS